MTLKEQAREGRVADVPLCGKALSWGPQAPHNLGVASTPAVSALRGWSPEIRAILTDITIGASLDQTRPVKIKLKLKKKRPGMLIHTFGPQHSGDRGKWMDLR